MSVNGGIVGGYYGGGSGTGLTRSQVQALITEHGQNVAAHQQIERGTFRFEELLARTSFALNAARNVDTGFAVPANSHILLEILVTLEAGLEDSEIIDTDDILAKPAITDITAPVTSLPTNFVHAGEIMSGLNIYLGRTTANHLVIHIHENFDMDIAVQIEEVHIDHDITDAVQYIHQILTLAQKRRARNNIGAVGFADYVPGRSLKFKGTLVSANTPFRADSGALPDTDLYAFIDNAGKKRNIGRVEQRSSNQMIFTHESNTDIRGRLITLRAGTGANAVTFNKRVPLDADTSLNATTFAYDQALPLGGFEFSLSDDETKA